MEVEQLYTQMQKTNEPKNFIHTLHHIKRLTRSPNGKFIVLNIKLKVIKLLEENMGENLFNFRLDEYFLDRKPKHDPFFKILQSCTSSQLKISIP